MIERIRFAGPTSQIQRKLELKRAATPEAKAHGRGRVGFSANGARGLAAKASSFIMVRDFVYMSLSVQPAATAPASKPMSKKP
jgi:hypothetical protein